MGFQACVPVPKRWLDLEDMRDVLRCLGIREVSKPKRRSPVRFILIKDGEYRYCYTPPIPVTSWESALGFLTGPSKEQPVAKYCVFSTDLNLVLGGTYQYEEALQQAEDMVRVYPGSAFKLAQVLPGSVESSNVINTVEKLK